MNDAKIAIVLIIRQGFLKGATFYRVLAQEMRFVIKNEFFICYAEKKRILLSLRIEQLGGKAEYYGLSLAFWKLLPVFCEDSFLIGNWKKRTL